jgi:energy-coupling factor transporter ATP-binding protein EcfA2
LKKLRNLSEEANAYQNVCNHVVIVDDVWFKYEEEYVLKRISLKIEKRDIHIVMGPNGSGKSTLLKILAGILKPQKGRVYLCDRDIDVLARRDLTKYLGYVHQNPWFYIFNPTIYEEVAFTLRNLGIDENTISKNILEVATELDIVDLLDRSPFTLSEGEARRVVITSAVAHKPLLLLMDEPTAGLDYNLKKRFVDIIEKLNTVFGTAIIIATHDTDILTMIDNAKLVIINKGEIVYRGEVKDALNNPKIFTNNNLSAPVEVEIASRLGISWRELINFNGLLFEVAKLRGSLCR